MLKHRAFAAVLWSGGDTVLRQGLQLLATVVLARLLSPSDFGVVAMLALFMATAFVLMDGGFSAALIQRRDIDHVDESTVFWCNLAAGLLLTLLMFSGAPLIADLFDAPILVPLTRVMSLGCLFASIGSIHGTLLTRRLDFRTQAKASTIAASLSGVVAISLAMRGHGVWALAAQSLVMSASLSGLLWMLHPWRPAFTFSRRSLNKLFGFGGFHLASSLLEVGYSRLYTVVIGSLFGARELGLYANAENTRQIPGSLFGGLVARVALPVYSAAAHDRPLLRRGIQLSIRGTMVANVPVMLGMAALAEPIVAVLFGHQWIPAAPLLQVLCLAGVLYPMHAVNLHALMAMGEARLMFRLELIKKAIGLALIVAGAWHGAMGVAWSQVLFSVAAMAVNAHYTKRRLGYGTASQLREVLPFASVAAVIALAMHFAGAAWDAPALAKVLVLGGFGALAYLSILTVTRIEALEDIALLLRGPRPGTQP